MTDYMEQDAERLIQTLESCAVDPMSNGYAEVSKRLLVAAACSLRTLIAHIQRGAVPEGWQLVPINHTPEMRAAWDGAPDSEDDDMAFHFGYRAMLAAAPAPDHFRDAAGMIAPDAVFAVIYDDRERQPEIIHTETAARERFKRVSDQWNAHLFVKVESNSRDCRYYDANIASALIPSGLADPAPAEVPMPEPMGWVCWNGTRIGDGPPHFCTYEPTAHQLRERVTLLPAAISYGAACCAAGEAAGYARGRKEAGRDAERYRWLRDVSVPPHNFYLSVPDEFAGVRYAPTEVDAAIDASIDALRGEVKP